MRREAASFSAEFFSNSPTSRSVNENWSLIKNNILALINKHVPSKMSKSFGRRLPWIDTGIKRQMRKREKLYKKARTRNNKEAWTAYKKQRNLVQRKIHYAHDQYISEVIGQSLKEGNPKRFFSYLGIKRTENMSIPVLFSGGNHHVTDATKAEALSSQFSSAFTVEPESGIPSLGPSPYPDISDIIFTQNGISKLLLNIRPCKAAGPDELPARVLKELANEISAPLTFLYQQSFETGELPHDWSQATVTAIYKKGSKLDPGNYRPVSLTCILCKSMEHIVFSHMASFPEDNDILTFRQHGFRPGFSCETQLVSAIHDWALTLNSRGQTDVALLDLVRHLTEYPTHAYFTNWDITE